MECLSLHIENRIAVLTVNRPKALNALNNQVFEELAEVLPQISDNSEVGVLIITGSGEKAFVAGADIKELAELDEAAAVAVSKRGQAVFRTIENFPKPVVAAINGFALGGGCELALSCHMRIASETARLGLPEVGLGLIPGYGGTQRLSRIVGKGLAMEITLSGDMVKADRALAIGLVNQLAPPEVLMETCTKLAGKMLAKSPAAISLAIQAINQGLEMTQTEGENLEAELFGSAAGTADASEGLTAFIEKRQANFTGK